MSSTLTRREMLQQTVAGWTGAFLLGNHLFAAGCTSAPQDESSAIDQAGKPLFQISLAEWSLHRALNTGTLMHLDFAKVAKETYGIHAVEYVNSFFKDKADDVAYIADMKKRCDDLGVRSLLIMCDGEGALGDSDTAKRLQAVTNHHRWVRAANQLECHSIRVNARSSGTYEEQQQRAADGLRQLTEYAQQFDINVIVENHGGLSSNGAWLAGVMRLVGLPTCGTLPDFGNFHLGEGKWYDRYQGVEELMPFAKAVSAKSHAFDGEGNETGTDYRRMMKIVCDAGYRGYVGIEYEGSATGEHEGIQATKHLLEIVREELTG